MKIHGSLNHRTETAAAVEVEEIKVVTKLTMASK
jgi:hypothetical protein